MLPVSSGYKNDLVCAQHAVSLTSFNFTARVGFITLRLSECECVCVCMTERERRRGKQNECSCEYIFAALHACWCSSMPHLCTHIHLRMSIQYIFPCLPNIQPLQHVITIQWKNQLNQHMEQLSHHTQAKPVVPVQETEGLYFAVTNLTSDQMLQSHNHVCATEFFNLSMTPLNASGPITEPN